MNSETANPPRPGSEAWLTDEVLRQIEAAASEFGRVFDSTEAMLEYLDAD